LRRFDEALPLFQRALTINEKLYGKGTAIVAQGHAISRRRCRLLAPDEALVVLYLFRLRPGLPARWL
jgi:hypothetical protein